MSTLFFENVFWGLCFYDLTNTTCLRLGLAFFMGGGLYIKLLMRILMSSGCERWLTLSDDCLGDYDCNRNC
jgi:hypothetical protein